MFGSRSMVPPPPKPSADEVELLLQDVNAASGSARAAWILLIAVEAYFFIALAGIGHRDLLLNTPVAQPILQIAVPLKSFIVFGPLVLIAMHAGVLLQHIVLARKLKALDAELRRHEAVALAHPARLRVHGYYFAQIEAGPETSRGLRAAFRLTDALFLKLLPLALLLAFQIVHLPSHDVAITWWHRTAVLADILLLATAAGFLAHVSKAYPRPDSDGGRSAASRALGIGTGVAIAFFSVAVASVPGEWIDRTLGGVEPISAPVPHVGSVTRNLPPGARGRRAFWPTAVLFEGAVDDWTRRSESLFSRNLIVIDEDLTRDGAGREVRVSLRGRDLNHATFDGSDMRNVDLTDTSLKGASLIETNLEYARLVRVRMQGADLTGARLRGVEAQAVLLDGARLCEGETPLPLDYIAGVERVRCPGVGR